MDDEAGHRQRFRRVRAAQGAGHGVDRSTEGAELDAVSPRREWPQLRAALGEERDGAAQVSVGLVMEADGHLDQSLKQRLEGFARGPPAILEQLVDLEEQASVEQRRRRAERPPDLVVRARRFTPGTAVRQRFGKPLRTPAKRGQIGDKIRAQPDARLGSLEHIRGSESLYVVIAEVPSDSARVCLTGKGGEGVNPCLGGRIAQGVEAPSGDPVP